MIFEYLRNTTEILFSYMYTSAMMRFCLYWSVSNEISTTTSFFLSLKYICSTVQKQKGSEGRFNLIFKTDFFLVFSLHLILIY